VIERIARAIETRLRRWSRVQERRSREAQETLLPRPRLRPEHVADCRVLLDRATLLEHLPHGGCVAELGVDEGGFSAAILERCRPRHLHLVDPWSTRRYGEDKRAAVCDRFRAGIATGTVTVHRALSVDAASGFAGAFFDWIYIDTTHRYDTTRDELRVYEPLIRPGGYIAGHDFVMGNWVSGMRYGVVEAVQEFCVERGWRLRYITVQAGEPASFAIQKLGE
jgi:hypothetical protein